MKFFYLFLILKFALLSDNTYENMLTCLEAGKEDIDKCTTSVIFHNNKDYKCCVMEYKSELYRKELKEENEKI